MREKYRIIKLPLTSYCGIEFNNINWHKHLNNCEICKIKHEEYRNNFIDSWDKKCECGCGKITEVGKKRIVGHGATGSKKTKEQKLNYSNGWSSERKLAQSIKWKENNPLFDVKNKKYGENNLAKTKDIKKKLSINNAMKNVDHKIRCIENRKLAGYDKTINILKNRWNDKNLLEKRIKTYCENLANGKIKLKNNWKCGEYNNNNGVIEWFDSSYEEIRMKYFNENNISWTKKHGIMIPYKNERGQNTYYVPDFKIIENDVIIIEEIKGWIKENDKLKAIAGIDYCKKNNYVYRFLLGKELRLIEELSYSIK